MLYESNYYGVCDLGDSLMHHGVKGQKWGVRRYQNPDGTYTAEGKQRRLSLNSTFVSAERAVLANASNKLVPFKKESVNAAEVRKRGNLTEKEAKQCIEIASRIFDRSSAVEPRITNDVITAVSSSGASMYGLQYRLKQPTSLASKIGADAKSDRISFKASGDSIKDAIRYTAISENGRFTSSYSAIKKSLADSGYTEIRCKNYFDLYSKGKVMHKSVQSVFEDGEGNRFELQFQTPSSQAAKELKIPIYEERRRSGNSESRNRELERQMVDLAEHVKNPRGVMRIKSH